VAPKSPPSQSTPSEKQLVFSLFFENTVSFPTLDSVMRLAASQSFFRVYFKRFEKTDAPRSGLVLLGVALMRGLTL
jgi:hypothetical protein